MKISVIVPVFDSERTLGDCVSSVFEAEYCDFEVIVVDDHSNDNSRAIARTMPCKLIELSINSGPAAARNCGAAAASGSLLFFLDADILIRPDSLARLAATFERRPDIAALFGSYQADTPSPDFFSQYKNLLHHYTHQISRQEAITFASGFGAVRAEVFASLGGFDPALRFLEDIDFGYRLHSAGNRIWLDKQLQLTHCKRYTFASLLRSDFFGRAIPWAHLMLQRRTFQNDLNTRLSNVVSVPVSILLLAAPLSIRFAWVGTIALTLIMLFLVLNRGFLKFVLWQRVGGSRLGPLR